MEHTSRIMQKTRVEHRATFNILMLHGFAQNGPFFLIKTRKLCHLISQSLLSNSDFLRQYPGGIKFLDPSGPLVLLPSNHAWWRHLDTTSQYAELNDTFVFLRTYIEGHGPVHGVVGFSQGASLAAMVASWCESSVNPVRAAALRNQKAPMTVQLPNNQGPLKFAVCISGFCGTEEYYSGFYTPRIETPTLQVMGMLDGMVSEEHVRDLASACVEGGIVCHAGGHYVPSDMDVLWAVVGFVKSSVTRANTMFFVGKKEVLWVEKREMNIEPRMLPMPMRTIRRKYVAIRSRQIRVMQRC